MANDSSRTRVMVVGAGLAGSLLAYQLGQRGFDVTVYERRQDPRLIGAAGGRSINLALSCRGLSALRMAGLDEPVLTDAIAMPGRMLHSPTGELAFQPYSKDSSDAIYSVSRGNLNIALLNAADTCRSVRTRFSHRCIGVDLDRPAVHIHDERSGDTQWHECDVLIGADGAFSAIRSQMQRQDRFNYAQHYLEHGYKELSIPPAEDCGINPSMHNGFAMDPNALHIWPRGRFMMIALPNADRSFTCTLFWPFEGETSFESVGHGPTVRPFFERHFPDACPLLTDLEHEYAANPVGSLVTIRCHPWNVGGRVGLIGDAAHAIVPFYGQGINCGFEDCRLFIEMLERNNNDIHYVVSQLTRMRQRDCDTIADLALDHFHEMSAHVADESFLQRKRVEHALHTIDGDRYIPLYNLVSFSNMPYAEAKRQGGRVVALAETITSKIGPASVAGLTDDALLDRVRRLLVEMDTTP